jgi:thiazole synthase
MRPRENRSGTKSPDGAAFCHDEVNVSHNEHFGIILFIDGGKAPVNVQPESNPLTIGGKEYKSRLIIGTGKYKSYVENAAALEASGAEMVTVAVRRVNLIDPNQPMLTDFIDPKKYTYLPNTAGCFTADDALRTLRLAREAGGWTLVKLEVLGDQKTLYPNMPETLKSAEVLIKEGFQVMVYCSDDPIQAKRLEEIGCVAIMPLAAPIGSGLGVQNPVGLRLIVEQANVPVIVDAGVGTASDAAIAMELGCDAVLMNTAIAEAKDPVQMAAAMNHAVRAGRLAYLAGRMQKKRYADLSSPLAGLI